MDRCIRDDWGAYCDCWQKDVPIDAEGFPAYVCSTPGYEKPLSQCIRELQASPSQPLSLEEARSNVASCMLRLGWTHIEHASMK